MNFHLRQTAFIGPKNQATIQNSTIAIIGLGALGSAAAHLLARMGVGTLILLDNDVVADHNLSRQHLYTVDDIGTAKVQAAQHHIQACAPQTKVEIINAFFDETTKLPSVDLIIDGTDNHHTRRCIDAYAKQQNLPWVHGAAIEDKGTVVFFPTTLQYNDVYKETATDQHCSISGVLATTTTLVATLQVQLAIECLLGKILPLELYHISGHTVESVVLKSN